MEAVGLGIGVAGLVGLFSTCLDMVERWDSYKDFGVESEFLRARLTADRIRFRQWGQKVGIGDGRRDGDHHKALDDPSIRPAIDLVLRSIKNIENDANTFASPFRNYSNSTSLPVEGESILQDDTILFEKSESITSRRSRLGWALRGKARVLKLVASFEVLVQKLYDLVPPSPTTADSHMAAGGGPDNSTASIERENSWHHDAQKILADLEKQIHDETRKEIIDWLDAPDSKRNYDDSVHRRLNGTCDWILERPEFLQWQSLAPGDAEILWINGPAGYGKTILSARIVEHISTKLETPLAYFFFSSEIESRADPFVVMRSWILRLMTQTQQAFDLTREKREATDGRTASRHDIKELFNTIVQNLPHCMFVVDGLDECAVSGDVANSGHNDSLLEFLESLTHTMSKSRSRLLIVSRNDLRIREGLNIDSNEIEGKLLELQIFPKDVEADATLYSQSIVNRKLGNKSEAQREELSNRLVNRCQSMFLAIKLLEDDLRGGKNLKQLQRAIDQAPNKLDHIYDRNWGRIQNLEDTSRRRAFWILRWATFALRPLTVLEITECLLLPDGECDKLDCEELPDLIDEIYIKTEILDLCGSLIDTRPGSTAGLGDSTIHLTHFSVRQYILCHMPTHPAELIANEQLRSSNESIQNSILAKACLHYLSCDQIWKETQHEENGSTMIQAFRAYAADSWYQHVKRGANISAGIFQLINAFFHPSNENWELWRKYSSDISFGSRLHYGGNIEHGNRLFYAALLGLSETVDYLIEEVGLDVNLVDSSNRTALLAASWMGYASGTAQLLEKGADVNIGSNNGSTPLHFASHYGNVDVMKLLLIKGADLGARTHDGWTALHQASYSGHVDAVRLLLDEGAYFDAQANEEWTPLLVASYYGHVGAIELLLEKGADLEVRANDGWTALGWASFRGHVDTVRLLLSKGVDQAVQDNSGCSSLHIASYYGHIGVMKVLLENGTDLAVRTNDGWTALHEASRKGHVEAMKLLLEEGADLTARTNDGATPLHEASYKGHIEAMKLLLKKGADLAVRTNDGWTALHEASRKGHIEAMKLLLDEGADLAARTNDGATPLHEASYKGHIEAINLLFEKGADPRPADNGGWTPLHMASQGHIEIVKILLGNGADPCVADNHGWTPLHLASKGHIEIVKVLLGSGADPCLADNHGWTPLHWASQEGSIDVAALFLERGLSVENICPHNGRSLLSYAVEYGHIDLVEYLLQRGANPTVSDKLNRNILHYAAMNGNVGLFDLLSASNVSIESPDYYGSTLLSIATRYAHIELVRYLLSHEGIGINAKDNFGRTVSFWATNPTIRQIFTETAAEWKESFETTDRTTHICSPRDPTDMRCDVCIFDIVEQGAYYHCNICCGGDFDICEDCYVIGASCLGDSHGLVKRTK